MFVFVWVCFLYFFAYCINIIPLLYIPKFPSINCGYESSKSQASFDNLCPKFIEETTMYGTCKLCLQWQLVTHRSFNLNKVNSKTWLNICCSRFAKARLERRDGLSLICSHFALQLLISKANHLLTKTDTWLWNVVKEFIQLFIILIWNIVIFNFQFLTFNFYMAGTSWDDKLANSSKCKGRGKCACTISPMNEVNVCRNTIGAKWWFKFDLFLNFVSILKINLINFYWFYF